MSANIRGVTFAEQTVTPADDAIVRRAMLSDGILSGCSITYSGSTLTLAAGYMIACGRIFQITAARNWAVVDATSGVARLVLTIDLTKTATESAFDQISFGIEYATAEDGFVSLTQDDINVAGTRYQVAVAVVSLGTGGITGIVSKLEKAEGGGGLNFSVVGGLTQPANQKENTIWVLTNVPITSWIFSATEPDPPADGQDGLVWIFTGVSSPIAFSATKKNPVMVYPISAKQYINGTWVDRDAEINQDGKWVSFDPNRYLYRDGTFFVPFTKSIQSANQSITYNEDRITFSYTNPVDSGFSFGTTELIDVSQYNYVCIDLAFSESGTQSYPVKFGTKPSTEIDFNKYGAGFSAQTSFYTAKNGTVCVPIAATDVLARIVIDGIQTNGTISAICLRENAPME